MKINLISDLLKIFFSFDGSVSHLDFSSDYMDVATVEDNLVLLKSKKTSLLSEYHSFILSVENQVSAL